MYDSIVRSAIAGLPYELRFSRLQRQRVNTLRLLQPQAPVPSSQAPVPSSQSPRPYPVSHCPTADIDWLGVALLLAMVWRRFTGRDDYLLRRLKPSIGAANPFSMVIASSVSRLNSHRDGLGTPRKKCASDCFTAGTSPKFCSVVSWKMRLALCHFFQAILMLACPWNLGHGHSC